MPNFDPTTGAVISDDTTQNPGVTQPGAGGVLQTIGQTITGSNNPFTNASFVPAMANAAQMFSQAGQYQNLGNQAAARADPFGANNNRQQYITQLSNLERDPSQIANTPGYQFALNQALNQTSAKLASQGYTGSSNMQAGLAATASGLAQQTYNNTIDQLSKLGGAQFDPANAARMQMTGGQLSLQAQQAALNAMMYPFGPGAAGNNTTINNGNNPNGSRNPNGGPGGNNNPLAPGQSGPSGILPAAGTVANLWQHYLDNGSTTSGMSQGDINILQDSGMLPPSSSAGGSDFAPPTYNTNGFGPDPTQFDSSTGNIINDVGFGSGDTSGFMTDPWSS